MHGYQTNPDGHRGTRAVQRLVEYAPATGSLALWMRHRDIDGTLPPLAAPVLSERAAGGARGRDAAGTLPADWLVGNDGRTIWYGAAFARRPLAEQTALLAHQVLHVALRHVPRERALRGALGDVDGELFNLCADAIVNTALSHLDWLALPEGSVRLEELLERLFGERAAADASLLRWDTESLYRAIDDRTPRPEGAGRAGRARPTGRDGGDGGEAASDSRGGGAGDGADPDAGGRHAAGASDAGEGEAEHPSPAARSRDDVSAGSGNPSREAERRGAGTAADDRLVDGALAGAARRLAARQPRDLLPGDGDSPEQEASVARRWSERLTRAHASDASRSLLRQLLADRSVPRTPWEQLLRTRLARSLAQSPELSWSRPTRSWLANRGRTANGRRLPWQPGISGARAVPRLCVIVDVSGSIERRVLARFTSELDRLMRVHRAEVHLIVGDERVRHESRLSPGRGSLDEPFGRLVFEGGGGTDFVPLLEAAGRRAPDAVVVLTDLEGPVGRAPPWPVIWALLPGHVPRAVPFGRVVSID